MSCIIHIKYILTINVPATQLHAIINETVEEIYTNDFYEYIHILGYNRNTFIPQL